MTSPPNDRSRLRAAPESFGGDTHIIPQAADTPATDAPKWDDVVDSAIRGQVIGYELGYAQGWHDALNDREAHHRQVAAARIGQDHLAVHLARQKAAARWSA